MPSQFKIVLSQIHELIDDEATRTYIAYDEGYDLKSLNAGSRIAINECRKIVDYTIMARLKNKAVIVLDEKQFELVEHLLATSISKEEYNKIFPFRSISNTFAKYWDYELRDENFDVKEQDENGD